MKRMLFTFLFLGGTLFIHAQGNNPKIKTDASQRLAKFKQTMKTLNAKLEKQAAATNSTIDEIRHAIEGAEKDLEAEDKMKDFEIQELLGTITQSQTLSSNALKAILKRGSSAMSKVTGMMVWW